MTATRARVCDGKACLTREAAVAALRRLIAGGAAPGLMNKYRCKHCKSWHIGHTRRRKARAR